jgi:hypothetical protein
LNRIVIQKALKKEGTELMVEFQTPMRSVSNDLEMMRMWANGGRVLLVFWAKVIVGSKVFWSRDWFF